MPLDIDGAGRSRSLACLPTAKGTVAPTRGQVPGGVLLGPVLAPYKVQLWRPLAGFFRVDPAGVWGVQGPLRERISGPGGLRARRRSSKFLTT